MRLEANDIVGRFEPDLGEVRTKSPTRTECVDRSTGHASAEISDVQSRSWNGCSRPLFEHRNQSDVSPVANLQSAQRLEDGELEFSLPVEFRFRSRHADEPLVAPRSDCVHRDRDLLVCEFGIGVGEHLRPLEGVGGDVHVEFAIEHEEPVAARLGRDAVAERSERSAEVGDETGDRIALRLGRMVVPDELCQLLPRHGPVRIDQQSEQNGAWSRGKSIATAPTEAVSDPWSCHATFTREVKHRLRARPGKEWTPLHAIDRIAA